MLRNNLTSYRPDIVQIRIPKLQHRLLLKPSLVDKQSIHHTSAIILSSCLLRGLHDFRGDNSTMRAGDMGFLEFAGNAFFDQITETECYFRDFWSGNRRGDSIFVVGWEYCSWALVLLIQLKNEQEESSHRRTSSPQRWRSALH